MCHKTQVILKKCVPISLVIVRCLRHAPVLVDQRNAILIWQILICEVFQNFP